MRRSNVLSLSPQKVFPDYNKVEVADSDRLAYNTEF